MTNQLLVRPPVRLGVVAATRCLRAACAAPSIHNSQPWRFRVRGNGFDVAADPTRRLSVIDSTGRGAAVSVGAAMFNLRVAALAHGWTPLVLLDPAPSIELGPGSPPDATVRALATVIGRRRTSRGPLASTLVPPSVVAELRAVAAAEGAVVTLLGPAQRDEVLALTRTAENRHRHDERYRAELAYWTESRLGRRDGIPATAFGPLDAAEAFPGRDFGLAQPDRFRRRVAFEPHPQLLLLSTLGDEYQEWLRAGQALQRVLLTATVRGVSTQPMTQALEFADLRELMSDPAAGLVPQLLLRIGYGLPGPATPRRRIPGLTPYRRYGVPSPGTAG